MGQLKALQMQGQYSAIDSTFVEMCSSLGIFTVEDFLIHDLNALISYAEKKPNSQRLKQGIDQLMSVVGGIHQPWSNGVALLKDYQQNKQTFSLLNQGTDSFLHGALREGFVTELVGPSSSGKTQVCLQAAASVAMGYEGGVVFFDTGNSFSAPRVARLISQAFCSTSAKDNQEALHKAMSKILCHPVFDIFSLSDKLHQLESMLKNQMERGSRSVQLLIVDSFSSLVVPVLGGSSPYGHGLMTSTVNLLKKIAHEYSICVLVTNHMVGGGEGGSLKPALGESWKSIPHVRLLLSHNQDSNACSVSVLKHPSQAAKSPAKFRIGSS